MSYFVYNVLNDVTPDTTINEVKSINLDRIITEILGNDGNGRLGEIKHFKIAEEENDTHKISLFRKRFFDPHFDQSELVIFAASFASALLEAELIEEKDGSKRRNKLITPGILIIKHTTSKLTLLKLEETNSINRSTYEIISSFVADRRYYKAAVITNENINIIDKNRKVANYWVDDFLDLIRLKDDSTNTANFVTHLQNDSLINSKITDTILREKINTIIQHKAMSESRFEPSEWLDEINNELRDDNVAYNSVEELFSQNVFETLDESFELQKKIVQKAFHIKIDISSTISIESSDIQYAILKQELLFDNGFIRILVPTERRQEISKYFERKG